MSSELSDLPQPTGRSELTGDLFALDPHIVSGYTIEPGGGPQQIILEDSVICSYQVVRYPSSKDFEKGRLEVQIKVITTNQIIFIFYDKLNLEGEFNPYTVYEFLQKKTLKKLEKYSEASEF